jgi:small-conductance mechanosensitive channel
MDSQSNAMTPLTKTLLVLAVGGTGILSISALLKRQLSRENEAEADTKGRPVKASRAISVISLVHGVLWGLLLLFTALIGLSQAGVDIGPMLAGAGVLGLVVGLGAQSLLKDILAGIFYVIDDAFRIGEYVEVGNLRGTVERISLRSMQVRHHRGALHTIPYGTLPSITNYSRDWVIVKFQFQLPLDTDVLKVKKIVKQVSASIMEEDEFGPYVLEPLKFQGIDDVDLFGLLVRLKFMAVPGEQFVMRREMLRRLQQAFAENGIEFAKRSVTVTSNCNRGLAAAAESAEDDPVQTLDN